MAFYMLHQTVIVLLGWVLFDWQDAPLWKGLTIAGAALALSLAGAAIAARSTALRPLFGMGGSRRPSAPRPARHPPLVSPSQFEPPFAASIFGLSLHDMRAMRRDI